MQCFEVQKEADYEENLETYNKKSDEEDDAWRMNNLSMIKNMVAFFIKISSDMLHQAIDLKNRILD